MLDNPRKPAVRLEWVLDNPSKFMVVLGWGVDNSSNLAVRLGHGIGSGTFKSTEVEAETILIMGLGPESSSL